MKLLTRRCLLSVALALPTASLFAQTTISYADEETSTTNYDTSSADYILELLTGAARQSGVISGTGSITKSGSGTLALSGANTFSGGTLISAGTLQLGNGVANGSVLGNITNNGTLVFDRSDDYIFGGVVSGTGGLVQDGNILRLSSPQTYTGPTAVKSGGYLVLPTTVDQGLSAATTVDLEAGSFFDFSNRALTIAGLTGSGRVYSFGGSAGHLTLDTAAATTSEFSGILGGASAYDFALTKTGLGTQILSGANTYTGGTTLAGGTLSIAADSGLGAAPAAATPGHLTLDGGILATTNSFTLDANRGIALGSSGASFAPASATTLTYGGIIAGSGGLTQSGPGTLTLSGANTYSGDTLLSGGGITLAHTDALQNSTARLNGGTLSFGGLTTANLGGLSGAQNLALTNASAAAVALIVGANHASTTYSGILSGSGSLTKIGTGTLVLSGVNTYTGTLAISAGTLTLSAAAHQTLTVYGPVAGGQIGLSGNNSAASGSNGGAGGTLHLSAGEVFFNQTVAVSGGAGGAGFVSGAGGAGGALSIVGGTVSFAQTVQVSGGNSGTTGDAFGSGGSGGAAGSLSISGGTSTFNQAVNLTGGHGGDGTVSNNTNRAGPGGNGGAITITGGDVTFAPTASVNLSGGMGGDSSLGRAASGALGTFTLSGGILEIPTVGWLETPATFTGNFAFTSGTFKTTDSAETLAFNATSKLGGELANSTVTAARTLDLAGNLDYSGIIAGPGTLTKAGLGNLTLSAANAYTGDFTITGGTLGLGHINTLQNSTALLNGGTLNFGTLTAATLGGLSGSQNLALINTAAAPVLLTLGGTNAATTYSGILSGTGSLL